MHNHSLHTFLFASLTACSASMGGAAGDDNGGVDASTVGSDGNDGSGSGSGSATGAMVASPMFGFSGAGTINGKWPTVSYGMQRFWDSPPFQWPSINTAAGVFDFSKLDEDLAISYQHGTMEAMYTLARTPTWASSAPNDSSCNYTTAQSGGGDGECDAPSDLDADGSGTNAIWKAWITAIATHANDATYLQTHAHIHYWEIWNEPDTRAFFAGSIAQLARMTEDANCIITGRGVIHQSGSGTATPCTATAIDPTAKIVMASAHAKGVALDYGRNELYCSGTPGPQAYQLPCPNPTDAIASAIDIVNFHMKPGNETGITIEAAMTMYVNNIAGILHPNEAAKPLWDGEASYSTSGFVAPYTDADLQASFMPRFYLIDWSLGITGSAWYEEPNSTAAANTSYQQTFSWLVGATLTTPCAAAGNVWTCEISKDASTYQIVWDASQSCSNGTCTTAPHAVDAFVDDVPGHDHRELAGADQRSLGRARNQAARARAVNDDLVHIAEDLARSRRRTVLVGPRYHRVVRKLPDRRYVSLRTCCTSERATSRGKIHGTQFATLDAQRAWLASMEHRSCATITVPRGFPTARRSRSCVPGGTL